jgi:hypothetical protein
LAGCGNRFVSQDECDAKAAIAWSKIDDIPLLEFEADRPAGFWRVGVPLRIGDTLFGEPIQ